MPPPNAGRLSNLVRRCAAAKALIAGAKLHAQALVGGHLPQATLETDLVLLYCRCAALPSARKVFDAMPSPSMHAYNILLAASPPLLALELLSGLLDAGFRPDCYAVPAALRACAELQDPLLGAALHGFTVQLGFLSNVVVSSALLDMYAKAGLLVNAVRVFDEMPERDPVVWNCMVTAYARAGMTAETLELFRRAQVEAVNMARDLRAVPSVLNVCGKEGEMMKGREIHGRMVRSLVFDLDIPIGNALIDMYAKCGRVDASQAVFAGMQERNVVSWSTLISCYGVHGKGKEALHVYEEMLSQRVKPNCITFTSVLSSCSHSGLVTDGRMIFESMRKVHGVEPTSEHYACMVDLLGRAGAIEEAIGLIKKMPMEPCATAWGALLSACATHNNVDVGEIAAYRLFELEKGNVSNYITLCGIYGAVGQSDGVAGLRLRMRELGMVKTPGCSWVDVKGRAHAFYQGSVPSYLRRKMFWILDRLRKDMGNSESEYEHADQ
ncbi:pentatricopeptide repeat-containing protein At3g12770-like [Triticum dicoccoides]|uniref:pentatricopeptide repeat-containing protein At3g12770-like n=1 Tax=Triticum dicoccoides TaxID=85692 RepID=UPI000E7B47ED|nr:pentatricopeptide repeat-containing protein At3g12770-like [Triticum dicoccoides]XP_037429663.1 pentatricopeptide repeat-containing protein At3g12770-like [Triticum dicoccoides]